MHTGAKAAQPPKPRPKPPPPRPHGHHRHHQGQPERVDNELTNEIEFAQGGNLAARSAFGSNAHIACCPRRVCLPP